MHGWSTSPEAGSSTRPLSWRRSGRGRSAGPRSTSPSPSLSPPATRCGRCRTSSSRLTWRPPAAMGGRFLAQRVERERAALLTRAGLARRRRPGARLLSALTGGARPRRRGRCHFGRITGRNWYGIGLDSRAKPGSILAADARLRPPEAAINREVPAMSWDADSATTRREVLKRAAALGLVIGGVGGVGIGDAFAATPTPKRGGTLRVGLPGRPCCDRQPRPAPRGGRGIRAGVSSARLLEADRHASERELRRPAGGVDDPEQGRDRLDDQAQEGRSRSTTAASSPSTT